MKTEELMLESGKIRCGLCDIIFSSNEQIKIHMKSEEHTINLLKFDVSPQLTGMDITPEEKRIFAAETKCKLILETLGPDDKLDDGFGPPLGGLLNHGN